MQKVRYVQGGTEVWDGDDEMPRRRALDGEQELELFNMVRKGFPNKDIAKKFGIAPDTVARYYRRTLRERGREQERSKSRSRIVAQRRVGQELTFDVEGGYVGRTTVCGVEETRTFMAKDDTDAIGKFDKWLANMEEERAFMDMVERRGDDADRAAEVHPVAEVGPADTDSSDQVVEVPPVEPDSERAASESIPIVPMGIADTAEPAYLIWARSPEPRCYGLYLTMESALREVDRLNDVAAFLGTNGAFEVEEVAWRG